MRRRRTDESRRRTACWILPLSSPWDVAPAYAIPISQIDRALEDDLLRQAAQASRTSGILPIETGESLADDRKQGRALCAAAWISAFREYCASSLRRKEAAGHPLGRGPGVEPIPVAKLQNRSDNDTMSAVSRTTRRDRRLQGWNVDGKLPLPRKEPGPWPNTGRGLCEKGLACERDIRALLARLGSQRRLVAEFLLNANQATVPSITRADTETRG